MLSCTCWTLSSCVFMLLLSSCSLPITVEGNLSTPLMQGDLLTSEMDGQQNRLQELGLERLKRKEKRELVVNGNAISKRRFPYFTLLEVILRAGADEPEQTVNVCDGVLVHPDIVLTTGDCVFEYLIKNFTSRLAVNAYVNFTSFNSEGQRPDGTDIFYTTDTSVQSFFLHPNYNNTNSFLNVAVPYNAVFLRLKDVIPSAITPISVNGMLDFPAVSTNTRVLGTGDLGVGVNNFPDDVQVSIGPVVATATCQTQLNTVISTLPPPRPTIRIANNIQLCAQGNGGGACIFDTGPLIVTGSNAASDVLVGMVNLVFFNPDNPSQGCGTFPQIYTRASALKPYLDKIICDASKVKPASCNSGGGGFGGFCFSGNSFVRVKDERGIVAMKDLAVGDVVQVKGGKYEPIYSFGHKSAQAMADYLEIRTTWTTNVKGAIVSPALPLEISPHHMVMVEGGRMIAASMVKKGDHLMTATGNAVSVESIRMIRRHGAYAPFTPSGTIVVNDLLMSNYIAYDDTSEYVTIGGIEMWPITHQWAAHAFTSVHRFAAYRFVGWWSNDKNHLLDHQYTDEGVWTWVDIPHKMAQWWMMQHTAIASLGVVVFVAVFGLFRLIELCIDHAWYLIPCMAVTYVVTRAPTVKSMGLRHKQA